MLLNVPCWQYWVLRDAACLAADGPSENAVALPGADSAVSLPGAELAPGKVTAEQLQGETVQLSLQHS